MKPNASDDIAEPAPSAAVASPALEGALQSILMLARALARQAAREDDAEHHRDDDESGEITDSVEPLP